MAAALLMTHGRAQMSTPSSGRPRIGRSIARLAVLATLLGGVLFAASPVAAAPPATRAAPLSAPSPVRAAPPATSAAAPPTITLPIWQSTYGWPSGDGYA